APTTLLNPTMMLDPLSKGFVAAVIGGMNSLPGAVLGGYVLGVLELVVGVYVSLEFQASFAFLVVILVLLVRPHGLLGRRDVKRVWASAGRRLAPPGAARRGARCPPRMCVPNAAHGAFGARDPVVVSPERTTLLDPPRRGEERHEEALGSSLRRGLGRGRRLCAAARRHRHRGRHRHVGPAVRPRRGLG